MKINYLILVLIALVLFFPIVPFLSFRTRFLEGFINFVCIYFITGFLIGFLSKVSLIKKMLIVTVPVQLTIIIAIVLYFIYPEANIAIRCTIEYIPMATISCLLGLHTQKALFSKKYQKAAVNLITPVAICLLGAWVLPDYYFYTYIICH